MFQSIVAPGQLSAMATLVRNLPPGAIVEVGVYHGGSAAVLYPIALAQARPLHLFDTFTGTPFHTEGLDRHKIDREFADNTAEAHIRTMMPQAKLHVGIYPDTHPANLTDIAFIHCDCDQYLSYRAVIDRLWPLVVPGGAMLFDDYPYLAGAKKAVEESFSQAELLTCLGRQYVVKAVG